ncbi:hypothetical protein CRUP_018159 [Coryphaenoides rupestris]|nr:hypothetical protein CRUP_018159 [Coryphaenoides rupestris]
MWPSSSAEHPEVVKFHKQKSTDRPLGMAAAAAAVVVVLATAGLMPAPFCASAICRMSLLRPSMKRSRTQPT